MSLTSVEKWLKKSTNNKNVMTAVLLVFVIGFVTGRFVFSPKSKAEQRLGTGFENYSETQSEEAKTQQDSKPTKREEELLRILNDQATVADTDTEMFDREKFGFYSPLFERKSVDVTTYEYKPDLDQNLTIINRTIELDNFTSLDVWQLATTKYPFSEPEDFVIFGGYENYLHTAIHVNEITENWDELYTSNGQEWFYRYHIAPKWIGSISLNIYRPDLTNSREPIPSFITVRKGGFLVENETDPEVLKAKEEIKNIVDTIVFEN